MNKKKIISKFYHTNLQLIDKLYNKLDQEWNEFCDDTSENELNNTYTKMMQINNELKDLLEYFDPKKEENNIQSTINWNQTMLELLPAIWLVYLYKFHSQ